MKRVLCRIPIIDHQRLERLRRTIVPLIRFNEAAHRDRVNGMPFKEGDLCYLNDGEPRKTFVSRMPMKPATDLREVARTTILIADLTGSEPTEAEVLAQAPPAFLHLAVGYEVIPDDGQLFERFGEKIYRRATAVFYAPD